MKIALLSTTLLLCACASDAAHRGGGEKPAPYVPMSADDGLLIWSAGADAILVDAKDEGLRDALALVDERLRDLPAEVGNEEIPGEALSMLAELLQGPVSLRAGMADGVPGIPLYAEIEAQPGAGDAQAFERRFAAELARAGVPAGDSAGAMTEMWLGPVPLHHGTRTAGGATSFVLGAGAERQAAIELGSLDLPAGVEPVLAFRFDYRQYGQALAAMLAASGNTKGDPLSAMRLFGLDQLVIAGGVGHGPDRTYGSSRAIGWVAAARESGVFPDRPLAREEIALVPSDATWAMLARTDFDGVLDLLAAAFEEQSRATGLPDGVDFVDLVATYTGLDLEQDLFDHLGETWGAYLSDTTGGGGWTSAVVFVELASPAEVDETLRWIETEANEIASVRSKGYVQSRRRTVDGLELATLAFPGLPVPIEVSWAVADGWLFAALSPQAVTAAIAHARAHGKSLLDHPRFQPGAAGLDGLYSLSFLDTPRLAREGYGAVSLACAAIANATRSPHDPARGVERVMPPLDELLAGARASIATSRVDGNDLVTTWQCDRSVLVNASGVVGLLGGAPAAMMLAAIGGAAEAENAKKQAEAEARMKAEIEAQMKELELPDPDAADPDAGQTLEDAQMETDDGG